MLRHVAEHKLDKVDHGGNVDWYLPHQPRTILQQQLMRRHTYSVCLLFATNDIPKVAQRCWYDIIDGTSKVISLS